MDQHEINRPENLLMDKFKLSKKMKNSKVIAKILAKTIKIKYLDLAWCDPLSIQLSTRYFVKKKHGYLFSGLEIPKERASFGRDNFIAAGDWDQKVVSILDVKAIIRTTRHFSQGLSWKEVGEIDWMLNNINEHGKQDGCESLLDVEKRCDAIDSLKTKLEYGGRFLTQQQINPKNFREKGGIGVFIDRNGRIVWLSDGAHRLAIARHLSIKKVPVCIHKIHIDAILHGVWRKNLAL